MTHPVHIGAEVLAAVVEFESWVVIEELEEPEDEEEDEDEEVVVVVVVVELTGQRQFTAPTVEGQKKQS
jgi:hypothetical protein